VLIGVGALLIAPAVWAVDTLGYATDTTFPAGGPQGVQDASSGQGALGFRGFGGRAFPGFRRGGGLAPGSNQGSRVLFGSAATIPQAGSSGQQPSLVGPSGGGTGTGGPPSGAFNGGGGFAGGGPSAFGGFRRGAFGGGGQNAYVADERYAAAQGGGTIAVSSQGAAAQAILASDATVAGIGGFSGAESDPSVAWLAKEVAGGKIRWVDTAGETGGFGGRAGATAALNAAASACKPVTSVSSTFYDCAGRASKILATTR
jgi:hypothetical protein